MEPASSGRESTGSLSSSLATTAGTPSMNRDTSGGKHSHLNLLREQHRKLQQRYAALEAQAAGETQTAMSSDSLLAALQRTVRSLCRSNRFSDITFKLPSRTVPGHRLVLACRGQWFNNTNEQLAGATELDLSHHREDVAQAIISWLYTDMVDGLEAQDMDFVLDLMRAAHAYKLTSVKQQCGSRAVSDIRVDNSVSILNLAFEVQEESLLKYATGFVVSHWPQYSLNAFQSIPAELLYRVVKKKTEFPLHEAVALQREDVIFLFLLEHDANLSAVIDQLNEKDKTALQLSLETEQEKIADTLIEHGADLNVKNTSGSSLLHQAITGHHAFAAKYLIERGADVSATDAEERTPLHTAGAGNDAEACRLLLDAGVDANAKDAYGDTPLHCAVRSGGIATATQLLQNPNINPDERNAEGHSALWLALNLETHEFAEELVRRGCSVNVTAANGDSMLHDAIRCSNPASAMFLLEHGCDVSPQNQQGETPLHLAAAAGDDAVVAKLLQRNAPLNAQDSNLDTPLMVGVSGNNLAVVARLLQSASADLEVKNNEGRTALGICVKDDIMDEICYLLLQKGADIDAQLPNGDGLLHDAIRHGRVAAALFLVDNGADLEARSADNETPLTLCILHGQPEIANKLCEVGAVVNIAIEGKATPLLRALRAREEEIASILVRHDCDVDITDPETGRTALHKAIADKDDASALFLMRHEADVNANNNPERETPLHVACSVGMEVMPLITELLRNRADINAQDRRQQTPLHRCLYQSHRDVASKLLVHPKLRAATRDDEDRTLFGAALYMRQHNICSQLLQLNPQAVEERDRSGMTYLHAALASGAVDDVDVLIKLGVDVNARIDDPSQRTALAVAVERGLEEEAVKLLAAGARHDIPDAMSGWTVAHMAASIGCGMVLDELIKHGADMNVPDFQGNTVLHAAMRAGHEEIVERLIAEDVDLDTTLQNRAGQTALHVLAQFPKQNATQLLQLSYARVKKCLNAVDVEGNTPLLLAFKTCATPGASRLCVALVLNGAQLNIGNDHGETCFSLTGRDRRFLLKLLEKLPWEQPWAEGDRCQECDVKFGARTRKHHCRHCGRLLCKKCSSKTMPIVKFKLDKPARVCDICFDVLSGATS